MLEHETGYVIWELLAFALFVLLLKKLAWTHLTVALSKREGEISSTLERALAAKEEAEETLRLAHATVAERDLVVGARLREAAQVAEEMRHSIYSSAENRTEAILEEGRREIQRLGEEAIRVLRVAASGMIIDAAGRLIETEMNSERHRTFIDSAIASLAYVDGKQTIANRRLQ